MTNSPEEAPKLVPQDELRFNLLVGLLTELGESLRSRSEPEHLYTAAAIAGFGAVSWGVAAVKPEDYLQYSIWARPAVLASNGIILLTIALAIKIIRQHKKYEGIRRDQALVAAHLVALSNAKDIIPERVLNQAAGKGYIYSLGVIVSSAVAAVGFCLSLAGLGR